MRALRRAPFQADEHAVREGVLAGLASGLGLLRQGLLGHDAVLGDYVTINPLASISGNVTIGDRVTVGTGANIIQNVTVGDDAVIGAGAVVLRTVPDFALMVGNPARQVGWMCRCARRLPLPAPGNLIASATCPQCQAQFVATATGLTLIQA